MYPLSMTSVCRAVSVRTTTRLSVEVIFLTPLLNSPQEPLPHCCWHSSFPPSQVHCPSIDEEYDLPAHVPSPAFFQRLACFLEWKGALEPHGYLPGVDQP
jgi:hypothetical protein